MSENILMLLVGTSRQVLNSDVNCNCTEDSQLFSANIAISVFAVL